MPPEKDYLHYTSNLWGLKVETRLFSVDNSVEKVNNSPFLWKTPVQPPALPLDLHKILHFPTFSPHYEHMLLKEFKK